MTDAHLTDAEITSICRPLVQGAAQVRYLRALGLLVKRRPDGRPLVSREHFNDVMGRAAVGSGEGTPGPRWSRGP